MTLLQMFIKYRTMCRAEETAWLTAAAHEDLKPGARRLSGERQAFETDFLNALAAADHPDPVTP